jgi:hypothetical protein
MGDHLPVAFLRSKDVARIEPVISPTPAPTATPSVMYAATLLLFACAV